MNRFVYLNLVEIDVLFYSLLPTVSEKSQKPIIQYEMAAILNFSSKYFVEAQQMFL